MAIGPLCVLTNALDYLMYMEMNLKLYMKNTKQKIKVERLLKPETWFQILDAQMETGTPYLVYKDAAKKSNQKNIGLLNEATSVPKL